MVSLIAVLVGALFGLAIYMILRRSIVDLVFGVVLLSHAVNLLVFVSGGIARGKPPLVAEVEKTAAVADPLPQALVLTAIVISFGLVAFVMVLVAQVVWKTGTDDGNRIGEEDD